MALGLALEWRGVDVAVAFDHPADTPESLRELPGQRLIRDELPDHPDVVVALDVAAPGRLGALRPLLDAAVSSVVIEHHASNPGFGRLNWIDPGAEAAVLRLDASMAGTRLGWRPVWDFDAAVARTARWYAAWHERGELRTDDDLDAYVAAAAAAQARWTAQPEAA